MNNNTIIPKQIIKFSEFKLFHLENHIQLQKFVNEFNSEEIIFGGLIKFAIRFKEKIDKLIYEDDNVDCVLIIKNNGI